MRNKIIIHIDMDKTLCDFEKEYFKVKAEQPQREYPQSDPGFFLRLEPLPDAIDVYRWLDSQAIFDVWILTAPSVYNPLCYTEKRQWVGQYFDIDVAHKLILSPDKSLVKGDYLIDDCLEGKGQEGFDGELIQFGSEAFSSWAAVKAWFIKKYGIQS